MVTQMSTSDLSGESDTNKTILIQPAELDSSTQLVELKSQMCPVCENEAEGCHPKGYYGRIICVLQIHFSANVQYLQIRHVSRGKIDWQLSFVILTKRYRAVFLPSEGKRTQDLSSACLC